MPFRDTALDASEAMQAEQKENPDVWLMARKEGNRNMYIIKTRDADMANKMMACMNPKPKSEANAADRPIESPQKERCIADDQWAIDAFYDGYEKANDDFKKNNYTGLKPIVGGIRSLLAAISGRESRIADHPAILKLRKVRGKIVNHATLKNGSLGEELNQIGKQLAAVIAELTA